jgi:hypothetical protein
MAELDERTIRERACRLWEQAGKPEGMDQHFWLEAKTPAQGRAGAP